VIHYASCTKPDEREHRLPLSTGEVVITEFCRFCGASAEHVADRADDVVDQPEQQQRRRGWPFPPNEESA
jgi:hypothetical protein